MPQRHRDTKKKMKYKKSFKEELIKNRHGYLINSIVTLNKDGKKRIFYNLRVFVSLWQKNNS
jgi:hypothetical protein